MRHAGLSLLVAAIFILTGIPGVPGAFAVTPDAIMGAKREREVAAQRRAPYRRINPNAPYAGSPLTSRICMPRRCINHRMQQCTARYSQGRVVQCSCRPLKFTC
jgi:hypothetical protein